jgi:hypothetical protein
MPTYEFSLTAGGPERLQLKEENSSEVARRLVKDGFVAGLPYQVPGRGEPKTERAVLASQVITISKYAD